MLTLRGITKDYAAGDTKVEALRGIDLEFGESEFAAILGPSGCGKTTLLNIIGGLDRYTTGDLLINGRSTKQFREKDWDVYRNHSIGFVFQSYNLIPHQTVLANVELALTLAGVSREERRRRATEVLERVGLGDQLKKRPNEMSGGQMQRVAIARALVNDPDILLADEPTGALDSETSLQVMDILREIARDKLVIMVTHNPDLAEKYATRTIRLLDGKVTSDTGSGQADGTEQPESGERRQKTSMSFRTALGLSLNNLLTKKGRTLLTAFAGSIGIIGIALIMSLSNGVNNYIDRVQRDTLSSYPIEIDLQTVDMSDTMASLMDIRKDAREHEDGKVYSGSRMTQLMSAWMSGIATNDLKSLKAFIDNPGNGIQELVSGIEYEYDTPLTIYRTDDPEHIMQVNPSTAMSATGMMDMVNASAATGFQDTMMNASMRRMNVFDTLLDNPELLKTQYDVLAGRMPEKMDEVVLIVNSRNELSDYTLYSLGLKDQAELRGQFNELMQGNAIESEEKEYTYDELMAMRFRLMVNTDYFERDGNGWADRRDDAGYIARKLEEALEIRVVGIIRPSGDAVATSATGAIGYRPELMEYLLAQVARSEIVREQQEKPNIDVFTGMPFAGGMDEILAMLDEMETDEFLAKLEEMGLISADTIPAAYRKILNKDMIRRLMAQSGAAGVEGSAGKNLKTLGVSDADSPSTIYIYPRDFESKERVTEIIDRYNAEAADEQVIRYTDYVGLLMSSVTTIINAISYVLIAFVAISLVVSSIMIGIITYISVLERTKEIGILRSIGASRKDISRVFNAETLIIGFAAGAIGIGVTLLLVLLVNIILQGVTGITGIAQLPPAGAVILVLISMALTLIAGIIPSRIAARKDPVVALRSE